MQVWEGKEGEYNNNRKALIITFVVNVLLLVALYFIVVWRSPVPPMSQFGLELNLGFTDAGSGSNQTTMPPSEVQDRATETPAPGDPAPQQTETVVPPVSPSQPAASKPQPTEAPKSFEARSKVPSPLRGNEEASEAPKEAEKKAETAPPTTKPAEAEKEVEKPAEKPAEEKPKVDPRAIFGAGGTSGSGQQPSSGSNQGNTAQRGDEGKPQGTVDGRSILQSGKGNTGDGAGYNLELAGWDFASKPNINDNISNRNGKIVFRITVDDNGKIVQAIPLEYNVSNEVLTYYRSVVNQLSFKRQSGNPTAEYSTGRITFIIKVD
ncbi:energy transducer TonB [Negadavirga shengliensis]|uniref:Energy transducer TonB n=1 Tax=Negadavirga shengliensis TaxID=1389218 RepID=A0ABV9T044_9BACT